MRIRSAARELRDGLVQKLNDEIRHCNRAIVTAHTGVAVPASQQAPHAALPMQAQPVPLPALRTALRHVLEDVKAVRDGPFRPFTQEPVVRAILAALGGTGGVQVLEAWLM